MTKMTKIIIALIVSGSAAGGALFLYILVTAPRMSVQRHIRTYQSHMAMPPKGSIAVPEAKSARLNVAPAQALQVGRQCYDYYCVSCHGRKGDGGGPVGQSYDVTPTDLRLPRISGMSETALTTAMLKGIGHEPVLGYIVPEEYRPFLAAYVKTFGEKR